MANSMGTRADRIEDKIKAFQRKYYLNIFIRGTILTLSILILYFLLASFLEYAFWLGKWPRLFIFLSFFGIALFCFIRFLRDPFRWWILKRGLAEDESARIIGQGIPSINDRLLNLLQLRQQENSSLAIASIEQKTSLLQAYSFDSVVHIGENKKYLKYLALPFIATLLTIIFNHSIITSSTERIVHFRQEYAPQAPFTFEVLNPTLTAFYNEDFTLSIKLSGSAIPDKLYILMGAQRLKLLAAQNENEFTHTFQNIQQPVSFQLEGAGFYSPTYTVTIANRPELARLAVSIEYPKYINRKNEEILNAGNLDIPEGSVLQWKLNTNNAQNARILFNKDSLSKPFENTDKQYFTLKERFLESDGYEIILTNENSNNKDRIAYSINVIKDQYPQISVNNFKDSVLYKRVIVGGSIADDYGITEMKLHYQLLDDKQNEVYKKSIPIPVFKGQLQQSFFYNWSLDSIQLKAGYQLDYYLQVWDNDGVNGRKSTRSGSYSFLVPTHDELITEIDKSRSQTEKQIEQNAKKATNLHEKVEEAFQQIKGKQNLDWQDKKMMEDIIQQKQSLDQQVEKMKEQNKLLNEKKDAFTEQDERIREKAEQLQKLMDELLDEETKKLFEELQKLLRENADPDDIRRMLDKIRQDTNNMEKELERTLELFKQVQYEYKFDQAIEELKKQIENQEQVLEKTEALEKEQEKGQSDEKENQELAKEQEKAKEEFEKATEKFDELRELGKELDEKEEDVPSEEDTQDVSQDQQDSQEQLEQNSPSKSKESQKQAIDKMQKMQQKMESTQSANAMEIDMENLESLRQILHGLIKLSFDQEGMIKSFSDLAQSDPRFNTIAQQQLKLKDDAKVLEDSLLALAKRDPFMGAVVTKEVSELNDHLDKAIENNKERRRAQAANEMQLSMTSLNNLALMLDSHYDMMMQMMANAKPSMKPGKKKGKQQSLSQMQQMLNERIKELKGSGKSGRELSEELAEMAAEQERIRKALQEMQEKMKNEGSTPGGDLPSKMEQTEMDLVNKQLTDLMIKRQQDILTRLLETEKSMREQDLDEERKGETAKEYSEDEIPKAFEEFLRLKEKEVELLKTVPPKLYPYYKKEVSEYFKRIGNQ